MKDIKTFLLLSFVVFISFGTAISQDNATITLPTMSAYPGTTIDVPIIVSTNLSIGIAQFVVDYNSSVIIFKEAVLGSDVQGNFSVSNVNPDLPFSPGTPGTDDNILVQVSGGGSNSFTGNDKQIAVLKFEVVGDNSDSTPLACDEGGNKTYLSTVDLYDIEDSEINFINSNITILSIITYTLGVAIDPANSGSVAAEPNKPDYNVGESVTLTATPEAGYEFDYWSGNASGNNPTVMVTMDANKNVTAHFAAKTYTLNVTVEPAGGGSVTIDPDKSEYDHGETVTLIATPEAGYEFDYWSGNASGTNPTVIVTMDANKNVTAHFAAKTYTLDVTINPASSGSVIKDPEKTNYTHGETVYLTATPAEGYEFDHWSGDATGTNNVAIITMNSEKQVSAHFVEQQVELADVSGRVSYDGTGNPVSDAILTLVSSADTLTVNSDAEGNYFFEDVELGITTLTLSKMYDHRGEINLTDAISLFNHLKGLEELNNEQKIVADVTCDSVLNARDVTAILRYLIGSPFQTANTGDWKFIPDSIKMHLVDNTMLNFQAYLMGDVDLSWAGEAMFKENTAYTSTSLNIGTPGKLSEKEIIIPIIVKNVENPINSVLFSVDYDAASMIFKFAELFTSNDKTMMLANTNEVGKIIVSMLNLDGISEESTVLNLIFLEKSGKKRSTTDVSLTKALINDINTATLNNVMIDFEKLDHTTIKDYFLSQNYPNPFNPTSTIRYQLPENAKVMISIYNSLGQKIRTLVNANMDAGSYNVLWDGKDNNGRKVTSGVYLYRMEAIGKTKFSQSRKMLITK